ncbi:Zinc finger C2H2 superfamily [Sergentomyia squamirostris]
MYSARFPQFPEVGNHFMDPSPVMVKLEVEKVCRICESLDNLVDISTEEFTHLNEKLHKISHFEDSYSCRLCFICIPCIPRLENAYEFKVQCEETYQRLISGMSGSSFMDSFSSEAFPSVNPPIKTHIQTGAAKKAPIGSYQVPYLTRNGNPNYQKMTPSNYPNSMSFKSIPYGRRLNKNVNFACAICSKSYEAKWKLTEHMQRMHLNHKQYFCIRCKEAICVCTAQYKQQPEKKPSFPCDFCGRVFRTQAYMNLHRRDRHQKSQPEPKISMKAPAKSSMENDNQNVDEKYRPVEHITKNPVTNIYHCDLCDKTFQRRQGLRMHYQIHTDERPHACQNCGKAFRCRSHLNRHMITHTGEKRYKCNYCGKTFTQSGSLRIHERIHTGLEPYSCTNCLKTFRIRKMMINHIKTCFE